MDFYKDVRRSDILHFFSLFQAFRKEKKFTTFKIVNYGRKSHNRGDLIPVTAVLIVALKMLFKIRSRG